MVSVTANENGRVDYLIPVTWQVFDYVSVQANSLAEAHNYVQQNLDEIPIDYVTCDYTDGSYEITEPNIRGCAIYQDEYPVCMDFVDCRPVQTGEDIAWAKFLFGNNKELYVRLYTEHDKVNALRMSIHETSDNCNPLQEKEYSCNDITSVKPEKILEDMEKFVLSYHSEHSQEDCYEKGSD